MKQTHFHVAELWRIGYRRLYCELGEKPLVVIVTAGVSSIYDKSSYIAEKLGCRILWLSREILGMQNVKENQILACCLETLCKFFKLRKKKDNVVALMVHAAVSCTGVERLKRLIPGIRVVSYVYDFMNLFVHEDQMEVWKEFHGTLEQAKMEYEYIKKILDGKLSDALVHKDGGDNWDYVKSCPKPHLWFPQAVSEALYQQPPETSVGESFCFIGTIVPKVTHAKPSGLFDDIMMETIFKEVSDQGYRIHAYVLNPHPDVLQEYQSRFPTPLVQLLPGAMLEELLPRCRGRYRWGWMMYHFPRDIVLDLVRITLPTKFFTYLALGIPPVVSEEFHTVCKLVEKYKCGVVVGQKDIGNLEAILGRQDYVQLQKNVLRARKELRLEKFLPKLVTLLRRVLKNEPIFAEEEYNAQQSHEIQEPDARPADVRATALIEGGGACLRGEPEGRPRKPNRRKSAKGRRNRKRRH
jgi:hypothetical protein